MKRTLKLIAGVTMAGMLFTHCGKNPLGAGAPGGLSLFAKIGKAMSRPSAVNNDENSKQGSKGMVESGIAAANNLTKGTTESDALWLLQKGIYQTNDTLVYFEEVLNKPSDENPFKRVSGRGEVKFKYAGTYTTMASFNPALITDVISWHFNGRENRTVRGIIDSVIGTVEFSSGTLFDTNTIKPGKTSFWAKNISATLEAGQGDTASFVLDSLDDVKHEQYGAGAFLDAHSGRNDSEGPKAFNFNLTLIHKNSHGPNPYLHYEDNEGIMTFKYPWGETGDSLYFSIHFYPDRHRTGEVRKNNAEGALLIRFDNNEDLGPESGTTKYYDEKTGEEIPNS